MSVLSGPPFHNRNSMVASYIVTQINTLNLIFYSMNLIITMSHTDIQIHDHSTILPMVLKDNMERKAILDLRVFQDTEDILDLQDHRELKDEWVIEV